MKPILSVVIANYNYGRFLETAIKSVIAQGLGDEVELIICDGGSTDNSVEIIRKYADGLEPNTSLAYDSNHQATKISWWCSEPDKGQSDAFNKGFAHANGIYGCWLNADDVMPIGSLKKVVEAIKRHPSVDWFAAGTIWLDAELRVKKCAANKGLPKWLQRFCPSYIVGGPSSFFRLSLLKEYGAFDVDMHYAMDTDLWYRFIKHGVKLHVVNTYAWAFRIHKDSKTYTNYVPHDVTKLPRERFYDVGQLYIRYHRKMKYKKIISRVLKVIKGLNGCYLKSIIDTLRYRGKNINEVKLGDVI